MDAKQARQRVMGEVTQQQGTESGGISALWLALDMAQQNLGFIVVAGLILYFLSRKLLASSVRHPGGRGSWGRGAQLAAQSFAAGAAAITKRKEQPLSHEASANNAMSNDVRRTKAVEQLQAKYEQEAKERAERGELRAKQAEEEKKVLQQKHLPSPSALPAVPRGSSSADSSSGGGSSYTPLNGGGSNVKSWKSDRCNLKRGG